MAKVNCLFGMDIDFYRSFCINPHVVKHIPAVFPAQTAGGVLPASGRVSPAAGGNPGKLLGMKMKRRLSQSAFRGEAAIE
jgi:hypothetical protein